MANKPKIDQLISALAGALRDFDAGADPMPREELTDALTLADAADEEHRAQVRELRADVEAAKGQAHNDADARGWERGYRVAANEREQLRHERDDALAEAARVRRGAMCLRERCRRLESRARGAEERADIARTAALYAWRMYEVEHPPFERGAQMAELHGRVAERFGSRFATDGKTAMRMIDVLGWMGCATWPKEEA